MKILVFALLMLFSISATSHPEAIDYRFQYPHIEAYVDQYGMYLVNHSDHFHYCEINGYVFEIYPGTRSRYYYPGYWYCV